MQISGKLPTPPSASHSCSCPRLADAIISPFYSACFVAKPLNRSEAKGDLVLIQTLLLFTAFKLFMVANLRFQLRR